MTAQKDYYKTLGVSKSVDAAELKKVYRNLAKKYHPDRHKGDKSAEAKFKDISEAYDVLSDPEKRQKYDMMRENPFAGGGFGGGGFSGQHGGSSFEDFGDIFSSFFGGGGRGGQSKKRQQRTVEPIDDSIRIPLHLAIKGGDYLYQTREGKSVKLKIPENCLDGHKLKLPKMVNGADLMITINLVLPENVEIDGLTVIQRIKVSVFDAIIGDKKEVRLYNDKKINVMIKPNSDSHTRLKIPKFGLKNADKVGDCFLELILETPKNLSDQQLTLIQSLKYNT